MRDNDIFSEPPGVWWKIARTDHWGGGSSAAAMYRSQDNDLIHSESNLTRAQATGRAVKRGVVRPATAETAPLNDSPIGETLTWCNGAHSNPASSEVSRTRQRHGNNRTLGRRIGCLSNLPGESVVRETPEGE